MSKEEFSKIRRYLSKTQNQMAQLLSTSAKAVQSFEQGWREIPPHVERQALFLLASKAAPRKEKSSCWVKQKCPMEVRRTCPAWEFRAGHLCWFINGTTCKGRKYESWSKKMKVCRKCGVFRDMTQLTEPDMSSSKSSGE